MKKNIIITILVVLVLALGIYIVFDKMHNNEKKSKDLEGNTAESSDYSINGAEALLDKFALFKSTCGGFSVSYYSDSFKADNSLKFLDSSKITSKKCSEIYANKDFSNGAYEVSIGTICIENNPTNVIAYTDLNEVYKTMYDNTLAKKSFSHGYDIYDYVESIDSFVKVSCSACGGAFYCPDDSIYIRKIKSSKLNGNTLYIDVYYYEGSPNKGYVGPEMAERSIIETTKGSIQLESTTKSEQIKEIEQKYLEKLDEYRVTFEKKNGNFVFRSVVKKLG